MQMRFKFICAYICVLLATRVFASPVNTPKQNRKLSIDAINEAVKIRRRDARVLEDSPVLGSDQMPPLAEFGLSFSSQEQHPPIFHNHFSWTSSQHDPMDTEIPDPHSLVPRPPSIPSLPALSTRSGSTSSNNQYPFPDDMTQELNAPQKQQQQQQQQSRPHHMAKMQTTEHHDFAPAPSLKQGDVIQGTHYRVLESGDFFCEHCGYIFRNPHKVC